jgi:hypothetical protein
MIVGVSKQFVVAVSDITTAAQITVGDALAADLVGDGGQCPLH